MTDIATVPRSASAIRLDKLGVLIALMIAAGWLFLPFVLDKPNRILAGEPRQVLDALPLAQALALAAIIGLSLPLAFYRSATVLRLVWSLFVLGALAVLIGQSGTYLIAQGSPSARISPGSGLWLWLFAFALMLADALARLKLPPLARVGILVLVAAGIGALLWTGTWNDLSILKEYANRADSFWREAQTHVFLAFGSVIVATLIGVPLGILCNRVKPLRAGVLNVLNIVQTVPSIALFGLLIAPLAWIAANVPGAAAIGIAGIGPAPAMVALFCYSLLPVVANTVVGLQGVPPAAVDAAIGMGMTGRQRLFSVELPLAFPVILTGIRIVLVQNIGLATIAALIGGGGFGVFVFQGVGQTAMDLVLLGAVPTVVLAFAAAVVLDAVVEIVGGRK